VDPSSRSSALVPEEQFKRSVVLGLG
jgi:hypothetical protein